MPDPRPESFALLYQVQAPSPERHCFRVEMRVERPPVSDVTLCMPAWIPGSYMIRDFARTILRLCAEDALGQALVVEKRDKQTWVCAAGGGPFKVVYEVFAWDLSVRAAYLDLARGYFNGASLLLRVRGLEDQACSLELFPPGHDACRAWRVATSLRPLDTQPSGFGLYWAESYDDLIDHPVEMGAFRELAFDVAGVPHRVAITGRHWLDEPRLLKDLPRICAQHAALFGELPIDRYLFLVTVLGDGYGGLEHRYSTSLICAREDLPRPGEDTPSDGYRRFLGLCSHEYFHLWHVKRIRPRALIEGSLEREVYTRSLWAFEGITSYYDELALVRASCIDANAFLGSLAQTVTRVARTPGRRLQTLAESSFDAWTKFYKPDENAPNALVSYYAKGALVALALDLTIRRDTAGSRSLDDVMRALWQRHGRTSVGVEERGVEAIATEISGLALDGFFAKALDSTEELDLAPLFASLGIGLRMRPSLGGKDNGGQVERFEPVPARPTLGLRLRPGGGEAVVQHVISDGAGERAGVAPGDVLVAIDGLRVTAETLDTLVARAAPNGDGVAIHLFRRDELLTLIAHPMPAPEDTCELMLLEDVPEAVSKARDAWLSGAA